MPKIWALPSLWKNQTAYILGGGPSLLGMDYCLGLEKLLENKRVIGVNNAFKFGSWIDACWFGDAKWFDWNFKELAKFSGLKVTCNPKFLTKKEFDKHHILVMGRGKSNGIEKKAGYVAWNRSSGASAINFAYHLGVKRIVLLGFDMHSSNGNGNVNHNWHKEHKGVSVKNPNFNPYERFLKPFKQIKEEADVLGLEILNATVESALTVFPMVNIKDVV